MCLTLCDPVDCSPPGSSVHGILQARVLEWVAISFSKILQRPCSNVLCSGRHAPWHLSTQTLYFWSSSHTGHTPAPGTEQKSGGASRGRAQRAPLSPAKSQSGGGLAGDSGPCEQTSASQVALEVKNLPASAGDLRDAGSIPGSGRCPRDGQWQPTPVFLPGESHGRRSLWATVHAVTKGQT